MAVKLHGDCSTPVLNDEADFKLMYLGLRNISQRWTMPIRNWSGAMNQFAILFEGRVPIAGLAANSHTQNPAWATSCESLIKYLA